MNRTRGKIAQLVLLTMPLLACEAEIPPVDLAGLWDASPARFDSITLDLTQAGANVSGAGVVRNDVADRLTFAVSGRYPEIGFVILAPSSPGLGYYHSSSYHGTLQRPDAIVGTLRYSSGRAIALTFTRREPRQRATP